MTDEQFNNAMERLRNRGKEGILPDSLDVSKPTGSPDARVGGREKEALREIYEEYSGFIYHVILDMVGSREAAEDITSEFFIRLWEKAGQYKPGRGHRGYLATIARNMATDHLRKYKREELEAGQNEQDEAPDAISLAASGEPSPEESVVSELSVEQALDRLKPVYRQIVTMKVLGEMTFAEIAETMSMPMGTVTWNYREAIKQLRRFGYE